MFYKEIVPLDRNRHRELRIEVGPNRFAVAGQSHIVPALVQEFATASMHLPIVFLPGAGLPVAVFLVGLRNGKSAMVGALGEWLGDYIPAYLRRYPFMFGEVEGRDPVVCIDGGYAPSEAGGEPLFTENGEDTPLLVERIRLMNDYYASAKASEAFVKALHDLGLLQAVTIDAKFESGESLGLHGLLTVDEQKLNALPDEEFLRLRKDGFLGPIYAHLLSLAQINQVRRLS